MELSDADKEQQIFIGQQSREDKYRLHHTVHYGTNKLSPLSLRLSQQQLTVSLQGLRGKLGRLKLCIFFVIEDSRNKISAVNDENQ